MFQTPNLLSAARMQYITQLRLQLQLLPAEAPYPCLTAAYPAAAFQLR
jgi:hypothetical protein